MSPTGERKPFEHRVRVRYSETDQMGVVYHANYLVYMEEGRTGLLASLGQSYAELEARGFGLAVRKADLRFRSPARYDEVLVVRTEVTSVRGASVRFGYEIHAGADGRWLASGSTELACLDLSRPERGVTFLPSDVRALLEGARSPAPPRP